MRTQRITLLLILGLLLLALRSPAAPTELEGPRDDAAIRTLLERLERVERELADVRTELRGLLTAPTPPVRPPVVEPEPGPEPPVVEPPTRPVDPPVRPRPPPVPAGELIDVREEHLGLVVHIVGNRGREQLETPAGLLPPRATRATLAGDVRGWAKLEAERLGWVGLLPAELEARLRADADRDLAEWAANPYRRAGYGMPAWGGGGWGVQRGTWQWKRSAAGLELALHDWLGWANRAAIVADWASLTEPRAYSLHRASVSLAGYPEQGLADTPDGAHLSRVWASAALLAEHTALVLPRWWMGEVWQDACRALGVGVEPGGWYWISTPGDGHTAPLWARVQSTREQGRIGWLSREWMHLLRLALELERLGIDPPGAPVSPSQARALIVEAIQAHAEASPWTDGRRWVLQFAPGDSGRAGYPVDSLPAKERQLGRWCLPGENLLWVPELRAAGLLEHADGLAEWLGPHPTWAGLVDLEAAGPAPRTRPRYGSGGWYSPWEPGANRVPDLWRTVWPQTLTAEELRKSSNSWGSNREHPWDYVPVARLVEVFGS